MRLQPVPGALVPCPCKVVLRFRPIIGTASDCWNGPKGPKQGLSLRAPGLGATFACKRKPQV